MANLKNLGQPDHPITWRMPRQICVRGCDRLGGAIMTVPALLRLREAFADAHIALLTRKSTAPLFREQPFINQVFEIERSDTLSAVARKIARGNFHTAVIFPRSFRAALEAYYAGVPERVGERGSFRTWLLSKPVAPRREARAERELSKLEMLMRIHLGMRLRPPMLSSAHEMYEALNIVAALGANSDPCRPQLVVPAAEETAMRHRLEQLFGGLNGEPIFALKAADGRRDNTRRWPEEYCVESGVRIHRTLHCRWLLVGDKAEAELSREVARQINLRTEPGTAVSIAGDTTLLELCAALKICGVFLTNDTGPMHVAAAVGSKVVALFGGTSPERTGPGLPGDRGIAILRGDAQCAPCFRASCLHGNSMPCLRSISPEEIVQAFLRLASGMPVEVIKVAPRGRVLGTAVAPTGDLIGSAYP